MYFDKYGVNTKCSLLHLTRSEAANTFITGVASVGRVVSLTVSSKSVLEILSDAPDIACIWLKVKWTAIRYREIGIIFKDSTHVHQF